MKGKFLSAVLVFQLLIIAVLLWSIKQKTTKAFYANPLTHMESDVPESSLAYYFQPNANEREEMSPLIAWTDAVMTTNSDGLVERFEYPVPKPEDVFRIVSLGDSFAQGLGVDTDDNYSERLEDMLNQRFICNGVRKFEVINLGVAGYDIQYSVERYRIKGIKYDPDLVLWLLKDDDFLEINEILRKNIKRYEREMKESGEWSKLMGKGKVYPPYLKAASDMDSFIKRKGEPYVLSLQQSFLSQFDELYKKKLVFLTFPFTGKTFRDLLDRQATKRGNTHLFYELIDIYENKLSFMPQDGHPTADGHRAMAEGILEYLTSNKLLPDTCRLK